MIDVYYTSLASHIIIIIIIIIIITIIIISEIAENLEQIVPRKTKETLKFAQ